MLATEEKEEVEDLKEEEKDCHLTHGVGHRREREREILMTRRT